MAEQNKEILEERNKRGREVVEEIKQQKNDLLKFALEGNVDEVSRILENRPQLVDHKDSNGNTALHIAAKNIDLEMLKLLVNKGADLRISNNADNPIERTALGILKQQELTSIRNFSNAMSPSGLIYEDPTEAIEFLEQSVNLRKNRKKRVAKAKSADKKEQELRDKSAMEEQALREESAKKKAFEEATADFTPVVSKRDKKLKKKKTTQETMITPTKKESPQKPIANKITPAKKEPTQKVEYTPVSKGLSYSNALKMGDKLKEDRLKMIAAKKEVGEAIKMVSKGKNASNIQKLVRGVQTREGMKKRAELDRLNRLNDFTKELLKLDTTKIKGIKELKAKLTDDQALKAAIESNEAMNELIGKFSKGAKSSNIEMLGRLASGKATERDKLLKLVDNFQAGKDLNKKTGSISRTGGYKSSSKGQSR